MYDNVQSDRQWIRRVMREEKNLIDAMHKKKDLLQAYERKAIGGAPGVVPLLKPVSSYGVEEQKSISAFSDNLDDISAISVATPMTAASHTTAKSGITHLTEADTVYSTMTSKMKAEKLQRDLQLEREKRKQMEERLKELREKQGP